MEGVVEGEDLVFIFVGWVGDLGVFLRELDGRFVGLGAGIRDERFGCRGHSARVHGCFDQQLAQRARPGVVVEVRGVDQRLGLGGDDLRDGRVAVAEGVDGDTRGEVEVAAVFDVPDVAALAFDHHGRRAHVGRDHVLGVVFDEGGGGGVGGRVVVGEAGFSLRCEESVNGFWSVRKKVGLLQCRSRDALVGWMWGQPLRRHVEVISGVIETGQFLCTSIRYRLDEEPLSKSSWSIC